MIIEHGQTATMEDLADDPVAGREWMKKYYSLLKKLELTLVPELMDILKSNDNGLDENQRAALVKKISIRLRGVLRCGPSEVVGGNGEELTRFIKGSLHRSIQLKWFNECLNDRRYRGIILGRCEQVRGAFQNAMEEGDAFAAQSTITMNGAEGYLMMISDYLEKFQLSVPDNARLATTTLKSMNADLCADMEAHQAYEVADAYTVVKDLTPEPIMITMGSCSRARIFGWEGKAIGLASMKSGMYEEVFRSGEESVEALKSTRRIAEKIQQIMGGAKKDDMPSEWNEKDAQEDVGSSMIANSASIPYIVTWEGRVKIPESTVGFDELFSAMLKDKEKGEYYAEVLRFQLLWYLRALTCRSEMQPKDTSPSKIIKTTHKPKQIPSTIRLKMFPREPQSSKPVVPPILQPESNPEAADGPRKSPIEHKRRLPKGFFATPSAVVEATKHGMNLAQEVQEDGSIRYIETFVRPRKSEIQAGDTSKITTIQAQLRESAVSHIASSGIDKR